MALKFCVTAAAVVASLCALAADQAGVLTNAPDLNSRALLLETNSLFRPGTPRASPGLSYQRAPQPKPAPGSPRPGVYRTAPYTCIVIVPGAHPDDKSIITPSAPVAKMPMIKPELKFIPIPAK